MVRISTCYTDEMIEVRPVNVTMPSATPAAVDSIKRFFAAHVSAA